MDKMIELKFCAPKVDSVFRVPHSCCMGTAHIDTTK